MPPTVAPVVPGFPADARDVPRGTPLPASPGDLAATLAALDRAGIERMMTAGQLAGMFAHELSNILTPLLSYAHLALANPEDDALARKALTKAAEGAQRAAFLADALLGRRGGPGERDRDAESAVDPLLAVAPEASVDECARRAVAAAFRAPGAAMNRARLAVRVVVEPGLRAAAHPIALEHVLQNLVANARLAMQSGGKEAGEIRVVARSTGNTVEIRVRDTGPGVPDHVRARLFEPFVTSRGGQGGFGLGLAVCRRLVEQAGGQIRLAPGNEGGGAEFVITLPAVPAPGAPVAPGRRDHASHGEQPARRLAA